MKSLVVAIVMPSLNEEVILRETCASLGFNRSKKRISGSFLFIVDNGSTDKTLEVARKIQKDAHLDSVIIGQERERGYVPPRHTGNLLVRAFAESKGLALSSILVLQADADTFYEKGYIEQMRTASQAAGSNFLVEGSAEFSRWFRDSYPEYIGICAKVDTKVLSTLNLLEREDLICTDAVCGYLLSDYFAWRGHLREFGAGGEIYAETTRLYMRARAQRAWKKPVQEALAYPSERKLIKRPVEELATAGFPRENTWKTLWRHQHGDSISLNDFRSYLSHPLILYATQIREQHMVAMFGLLPLHVARALERTLDYPVGLRDIASLLPERSAETLIKSPGIFITDVLGIVDAHGDLLSEFLRQAELKG